MTTVRSVDLRYEVTRTLLLAAPLVVGQITSFGMNFVDTVMAGRLGAVDLGAIAIGSSVWAAGLLFIVGIFMAVATAVSQLDGAGQPRAAGSIARQALWLAAALAAAMWLVMRRTGWVMELLDVDSEVAPVALGYLKAISWGAPALTGTFALRFFSDGTGETRPTMYIGLLGIACNIPLNYALMFGKLGFPALGAVGCGWATAIVLWLQLATMIAYIRLQPHFRPYLLFSRFSWPRWSELRELLSVGVPIGLMVFFEGSMFVAAALLIGTLGAVPIAAHQVAINFASMAFMVPLGLAGAITVRVGNAIGRGDLAGARTAGFTGMGIALCTQCLSALVMYLFPEYIARIYIADVEVIRLAAGLLLLAAVFQLPDGLQVAAAGALRGMKDTRVPMIYTVIAYWAVGLALGYWLTFYRQWGPSGMWVGMIAGLSVAAVLLSARFARSTRGAR